MTLSKPPCLIRFRVDDADPLPGRPMVSSCRLSDVIWPPTIPALSWLCHWDLIFLVNIVIVVDVYSHADDGAHILMCTCVPTYADDKLC